MSQCGTHAFACREELYRDWWKLRRIRRAAHISTTFHGDEDYIEDENHFPLNCCLCSLFPQQLLLSDAVPLGCVYHGSTEIFSLDGLQQRKVRKPKRPLPSVIRALA